MVNKHKLYPAALASITMILMLVGIAGAVPFAYITNYGNNIVSIIDTATNTVTATLEGVPNPYGVAVNTAGTTVYVTSPINNNIS